MIRRRRFLRLLAVCGMGWGLGGCASGKGLRSGGRVVVVGGGYGGATAARYLKQMNPGLTITLIEPQETYLSCPGSNEAVAGLGDMGTLARSYDWLRRELDIGKVTARVARLDRQRRRVILNDGAEVTYDRLVLSPGIDFRWEAIMGYDEAASRFVPHAWKAGPQTALLARQIRAMPDGGLVLITAPPSPYRCPPGPYERASLIAYYLKKHKPRSKILILDAKTRFSKQPAFEQAWRELYGDMVEWVSSEKEGRLERIDAAGRTVETEFDTFRADVLNVIPPQKAGVLAEQSGLTDASGWCPVDPLSFASVYDPAVYVIGDACQADPMPKSAFSANSQAKVCAAAIVASLAGEPPPDPLLINHCYSFVAPDQAISITGVYGYSRDDGQLIVRSTGETPPHGDRRREAGYARAWQRSFKKDVFGY
ncbi:NAD(P)/FAD-dependent oxidoreductase [Methylococcus capsulatus]|jgi:sulfide dehydrogenase [flavocytochrome c] flavoprotein subunit|uniref:Sulfide dehydrogenase [flavocytochrome c] flavoprotein chain n=1 Tax=Methylococcus capsulatus TaxID=414 RepID=A0AA35Y1B9_METCP|nr:NAD(P)/FAD-dependent oxidoreductase [Methylococcus capsulatus]CAI8868958.1 Sulfide dehydrogenase [flavocytochrome c] flavoprotein chain [Methylococcus capsulatus]